MKKRLNWRKRRSQKGSALPAILALTMGVGALTSGYVMRNLREHDREGFDRDNAKSLYDAWSQMEIVSRMVNASDYDVSGRNKALAAALARVDGQFIDRDGWPTGVVVTPDGGAGSGFFSLVSTATVGSATTRVSALCRERQSFADFNYFVASNPLGISGGLVSTFPYSDAPEGSIHSNDRLMFYFANRHFRDAVSAVNGFSYTAGAKGPGDPDGQNNWFHGPVNDHVASINGLTDVSVPSFATRGDNLLSLTGDFDYAKVHLRGTQALIEQWQRPHTETQTIQVPQEQFHTETRTRTVADYGYVGVQVPVVTPVYGVIQVPVYTTITHPAVYNDYDTTITVPVYTSQLVTAAWDETVTVPVYGQVLVTAAWTETVTVPVYGQVLVTAAWTETVNSTRPVTVTITDVAAWDETVTTTTMVQQNVWVSGGGGGDTGGGGGSGGIGYWELQWVPVTTTSIVHHDAVTHTEVQQQPYTYTVNHPAVYQTQQTGTTTQTVNHPAVYQTQQTGTTTQVVNHPAVYQNVQTGTTTQVVHHHDLVTAAWKEKVQTGTKNKTVQTGTTTTYVTQQVWQQTGSHTETYTVQVSDGFIDVPQQVQVSIPDSKVADHNVSTQGTVYVKGDVYFVPMTSGVDGYDTHVIDGSMSIASDSSVYIQDSILYGKKDANNVLQTAYLNGADRTQSYVPNPNYDAASVLGIVSNQDIVYTSSLPTQTEINATFLAKNGEVRVEGVTVANDGTVAETSGGWVKMSLRRLGGMTTNLRPVSTYVDGNSAVTRGFVYGKSIFDVRQRTTPPRGFPTLNRPRMLATILREVK